MKTANKTKKLDNIQEFMNAWKSYDYHRVHLEPNRWQRRFQEAGYFSVALSRNAWNAQIWHKTVKFASLVTNDSSKFTSDYSGMTMNRIDQPDLWFVENFSLR